ncbi:MAG: PAS domain S-box protein [Methanomassiliicoccus sp.]|nr:PAS domain S-box protein [Methanomassiliicoccus sp.]
MNGDTKRAQGRNFMRSSMILAAFAFGLVLASSLISYLLFHSLVETIISVVAFSVFIIAWTARRYMDNNYLMVMSVAYLFVGLIGIVHLLAYKGMGIFPGDSANLPTQLWIVSRYILAISLVIAPLVMFRKLSMNWVVVSYAVVASIAFIAIETDVFPAAFIDGSGLTPFKIGSEYVISALMVIAVLLLYRKREVFLNSIFNLLVAAIVFMIAGELMFTLYADPYGLLNLFGHLATLAAFLLVFAAIVRTGIVQPYDVIFRSLKSSEDLLRSERDFAEAIITNAQAIVLVVSLDGRILRVNPFIEDVTGWKMSELVSRDWAEALEPRGDAGAWKGLIPQLLASSNRTAFSGTLLTKNGETREVEWRLKLQEGANGRAGSILFIGHDVTEERRLGRELSARAEELARSNRDLDQFAYVASHDLQEPLRQVVAYLGLLDRKYGDKLDGDAKVYMNYAVDGSTRMRELITDLLAYSRVESGGGEFTNVDMNDALSDALSNLEASLSASNATVTAGRLPTVPADRTQMVQLLQNLIGNAIKYRGNEPPTVLIDCKEEMDHWTIAIKDNGIGIATEYHQKIFQMFQRLHVREDYEGTGIGLAIAKRIVERHGGNIWVESEEGRGSTFIFTLPRSVAREKDRSRP